GGGEEGEPHEVIPVKVRHEDVDQGRAASPPRLDVRAEWARTASHVAYEVLIPGARGHHLHAGGMAAEGTAEGSREPVLDECARFLDAVELRVMGEHERLRKAVAQVARGERHRQRSSGAPEAHAHGAQPPSKAAAARGERAASASRTVG